MISDLDPLGELSLPIAFPFSHPTILISTDTVQKIY